MLHGQKAENKSKKKHNKLTQRARHGTLISWGYLSPSLTGVLLFFVLPFFVVIYYSMVDNPINHEFVFLDNFIKVATNKAGSSQYYEIFSGSSAACCNPFPAPCHDTGL